MNKKTFITAIMLFVCVLFILSGCMYSRKITVEQPDEKNAALDIIKNDTKYINTSADLIKYIGFDYRNRLISLNKGAEITYIAASKLSDTSLRKLLLRIDNISDASVVNHGKNIVFRTTTQKRICLYNYDVESGILRVLYNYPKVNVKSGFSASVSFTSVCDLIYSDGKYSVEKYNVLTNEKEVFEITENSGLRNAVDYIVSGCKIESVYMREDNRAFVKAENAFGSYILSALANDKPEDIYVIESATHLPQFSGGLMYYINKQNSLMALNFDSDSETLISSNVKDFQISDEGSVLSYIYTEGNSDKLYISRGVDSSEELLDIRTGIKDLLLSLDGKNLVISYASSKSSSELEYLLYSFS